MAGPVRRGAGRYRPAGRGGRVPRAARGVGAGARAGASMVARLARVRGRLEAARGRLSAAEEAFGRAAAESERLSLPFQRGLTELAHGQVLRRAGQRRVAAQRLSAARDRFVGLRAPAVCAAVRAGVGGMRVGAGEAPGVRSVAIDCPGTCGGAIGGGRDEQSSGGVGAVHQHQDGAVSSHAHPRQSWQRARGPSSPRILRLTATRYDRYGSRLATWPGPRCGYRVDQVKTGGRRRVRRAGFGCRPRHRATRPASRSMPAHPPGGPGPMRRRGRRDSPRPAAPVMAPGRAAVSLPIKAPHGAGAVDNGDAVPDRSRRS